VRRYLATVVLVTALTADAVIVGSQYWVVRSQPHYAAEKPSQSQYQERPQKRPDLITTLSGLSNVVIAFFTVALTVAAVLSNSINNRMRDIAERSVHAAETVERANLIIDDELPIEWNEADPRARFLTCKGTVRNFGKSAAQITARTEQIHCLRIVPLQPADPPQIVTWNERVDEGKSSANSFYRYVLPEEWELLNAGKAIMFATMAIDYADIFGQQWTARRTYKYIPHADFFVVDKHSTFNTFLHSDRYRPREHRGA
jgi:hypothetical protein